MSRYQSLAIDHPDNLQFGVAPQPVTTRHGMVIGGGLVYPEINFTLPPMTIEEATWPEVRQHYEQIVTEVLGRAAELETPGVLVEFESLPPMTAKAAWGVEIAKVLVDGIEAAHAKYGLKAALRMTPNDNREMVRPPVLRSGRYWENMLATFEGAARAGAELLSIESVGGKEIHDDALIEANLPRSIFALSVLAVRDMEFLWKEIVAIAQRHSTIPAGDSACGFGNTAMVLAEQKMIPRVFAAVVRAVSAVRSLVAHEQGALGPGKDCAYENPILKAITGYPMSLEGKSAACAHFSPLGNVAAASCDAWSNESVQHIKLLAGMAPTCSMEMLVYDCRLMNQALQEGRESALALRRWLVNSDAPLDPQAYVLGPESAMAIARAIVSADTHYHSAIAAARTALDLLSDARVSGAVRIAPREVPWLDRLRRALDAMPRDEEQFVATMLREVDATRFHPAEYLVPTNSPASLGHS